MADANKVVIADTLSEALTLLLGEALPDTAAGQPSTDTPVRRPSDGPASQERLQLEEVQREIVGIEEAVGQLAENLDALRESLRKIQETLALEGGSQ